jgi:YfiH family protein
MSVNLLSFSNLKRYSDVIHHFSSTRVGGVSKGEFSSLNLGNYSDDSDVPTNRALLCRTLGIEPLQMIGAHQCHSANVLCVDKTIVSLPAIDRKTAVDGFDALICNIAGIYITVTTADCVPILLFDTETKSVAAIHSGWRGTLQNITATTIQAMHTHFGAEAKHLVAAIGPCIGGKVYEVGEELYTSFRDKGFATATLFTPKENGKYLFDIRQAVRLQLEAAGVTNIEVSTHCTYSEPKLFFSARRQSIHSGRMLSGIMLH